MSGRRQLRKGAFYYHNTLPRDTVQNPLFSKYRIILATKGVMEVKNVTIMLKWMVLLDEANDLLKNDERVIHNNNR